MPASGQDDFGAQVLHVYDARHTRKEALSKSWDGTSL
jgi:hypothetical protein